MTKLITTEGMKRADILDAMSKLIGAVEAGISWYDWWAYERAMPEGRIVMARDAYQGSLDAAKALHDALLPGWRVKIEQDEVIARGGDFTACVWPSDYSRREHIFRPVGKSETAARAWLLAILKACAAEASL